MATQQHHQTKNLWAGGCLAVKTLYLEDLVILLDSVLIRFGLQPNDRKIIESFANQVNNGIGFTEKQEALALKLIKNYKSLLLTNESIDIDLILPTISKKYPTRVINYQSSITILDNEEKIIRVIFPYDEYSISKIKMYIGIIKDHRINWNATIKSWDFPLVESHLIWIKTNLVNNNFTLCEKTQNYFNEIEKIIENIDSYIPMLVKNNNFYEFKNIHKNVPKIYETNLERALFQARKNGIFTWDDEVAHDLERDSSINQDIKNYFTNPKKNIVPQDGKLSIHDVKTTIFQQLPLLVVVPGGSELNCLKVFYDLARQNGLENSDMTVLFRLDNKNNKEFNDFVKINKLNNELNENLKVVFISGKIPKPLLNQEIYFNTVICPGLMGVNFQLATFIKSHYFVINCKMTGDKNGVL